MPRELGKAKRSDLTGHFPGEQAEYGSALARFLEGAGQLKPLQDGTYLDAVSGNGNGKSTEVGRNQTEVPTRGGDTEVAPAPGGNGQHSDNGSDTLFDSAFAQDEMFPEPAFDTEPMQPELLEPAAELEPVTFEPSSDTLHPDAEPESLDSVPDLTSPELDSSDEEEDDLEDTDILERTSALPTVKPYTDELPPKREEAVDLAPATSSDTGMLIAEAFSTRPEGDWDDVDFDDDSEDDRITDKIRLRGQPSLDDEDLTSVHPDRPEADGEKITNKVQPRRDVDPRTQNPDAVVRDTVNFYNQTQSLHEKKSQAGFPTISPNVVNSAQPLGLSPEGEESIAPDMFSEDESETDTLRPGFAVADQAEPPLSPAGELVLAPDPDPDPDMEAGVNDQELSPVGSEAETRIVMPLELQAESGIEDADRRETDKFNEDDRRPPPLPQPEGTDKLDKQQIAAEKADAGSEPQGLEPLADEKVASGKDTQRFYVAEILAKKESHTGDTTAELQPAQEGLPPAASSADTSADYTQDTERKSPETRREPKPEALPTPSQVHTDFKLQRELSPSARIIPEIESEAEFDAGFVPGPEFEPSLLGGEQSPEQDGDDTVDEEAEPLSLESADEEERRITEKVKRESEVRKSRDTDKPLPGERSPKRPARVESSRRHAVAASASSSRVKRITDSLSQRMKEEREETLRLIEQAEAVAVKLREASEQSRTDLIAISARRAAISHSYVPAEPQPGQHTGTDLEELPAATVSPAAETTRHESQTASSRRSANRVPTSAIGEIISELERSAQSQPISLTELLDQVSRRQAPSAGTNGHDDEGDEDDVDMLVAASARWREIVEDDPAMDGADESDDEGEESRDQVHKRSRRHSARTAEYDSVAYVEAPEPPPRPAAASSSLASDLDRLWEVLDSRRTATVVLPAAERARVSPRENEQWEGWTQEMLWPTLAGIAGVTFALGALFVWVLMKWAA